MLSSLQILSCWTKRYSISGGGVVYYKMNQYKGIQCLKLRFPLSCPQPPPPPPSCVFFSFLQTFKNCKEKVWLQSFETSIGVDALSLKRVGSVGSPANTWTIRGKTHVVKSDLWKGDQLQVTTFLTINLPFTFFPDSKIPSPSQMRTVRSKLCNESKNRFALFLVTSVENSHDTKSGFWNDAHLWWGIFWSYLGTFFFFHF